MVENDRVDNLCPHCKQPTLKLGQAPTTIPIYMMNRGTAYCANCIEVVVGITKVGALELILKNE